MTAIKTIETRSWPAPASLVGQRLAIHAAARRPDVDEPQGLRRVGDWWVEDERNGCFNMHGSYDTEADHVPSIDLPLGAVVGSAVLAGCVPIVDGDDDTIDWADLPYPRIESSLGTGDFADGWLSLYHPESGALDPDNEGFPIVEQAPYGDFTPGWWAWLLEDAKPTTERCPACWGMGMDGEASQRRGYRVHCITCCPDTGYPEQWTPGSCPPIPAKGHQRVWRWNGMPALTIWQPWASLCVTEATAAPSAHGRGGGR